LSDSRRDDLGVQHVTGIQQVARRRVIDARDVAQFLALPIDTDRSRIIGIAGLAH